MRYTIIFITAAMGAIMPPLPTSDQPAPPPKHLVAESSPDLGKVISEGISTCSTTTKPERCSEQLQKCRLEAGDGTGLFNVTAILPCLRRTMQENDNLGKAGSICDKTQRPSYCKAKIIDCYYEEPYTSVPLLQCLEERKEQPGRALRRGGAQAEGEKVCKKRTDFAACYKQLQECLLEFASKDSSERTDLVLHCLEPKNGRTTS